MIMQEELEQCRSECLLLCDRLLSALEENREDAYLFFGGEVYPVYDAATDKAKNKVREIRNKVRNL